MTPRNSGRTAVWIACVAVAVIAVWSATTTLAQSSSQDTAPFNPDEAVESYIERLGMTRLLAEELALRLKSASHDEKVRLAERLGKMYVQLLTAASTAEDRDRWEKRGRELLRDVPEADTAELRLSLNRAIYARAEEAIERGRLRLAEPAELQEAERQLRALEPQFSDIAVKANRRVESLERLEDAGDSTEELATALADARRIRSLAFFYAGWSDYYIAYVSKSETGAVDALKCFGWLLNSPNGRAASPDRMPAALLRYEHIARAAIGCALACGLRGQDGDAVRWLDAVDDSEEISEAIREQVLVRRITILGDAKRWADLDYVLRKARHADRNGGGPDVKPLPVGAARLLAVIVLEADKRIAGDQIEGLARVALADLVARQEIGQVIDLVRRYGTAPIGETGFIVNYVRGLLQYDQARDDQKKLGGDAEEPTNDAPTVNRYRAAAAMLQSALDQPDAETFKADRAKAAVTLGRALFFAGDLTEAGEQFAKAWDLAGRHAGGTTAEEALWLAIVAYDRSAKTTASATTPGTTKADARRAELAALYLQNYPDSPHAARIVLMQAAGGELSEDEALRILSEVPRDSPVYEPARRQVARLLYNKVRSSRGQERDFAAMRFVSVAEELIALDRKAAMKGTPAEARPACERLVLRARQMLDALLGGDSPDADRAQAVLDVLEDVAKFNNLDLSGHEAELTYRRFQIALARGRGDEEVSLGERLAGMGPGAAQFAAAAHRLMYKRVLAQWKASGSASDAGLVVRVGQRVIDQIGGSNEAMRDPAVLTLYSNVAEAATALSHGTGGESAEMRELAITLDRAVLRAQPRLEESLRRLAANAEAGGDDSTAMECWSTIFSASPQSSATWFEARYESLRLLARIDRVRARQAMDQHKLLYPDFGPTPWGDKLRGLDSTIPAAPALAPGPAAPGAGGGASGGGGGGA